MSLSMGKAWCVASLDKHQMAHSGGSVKCCLRHVTHSKGTEFFCVKYMTIAVLLPLAAQDPEFGEVRDISLEAAAPPNDLVRRVSEPVKTSVRPTRSPGYAEVRSAWRLAGG